MFVWLNGRVAKSAIKDSVPDGVVQLIVAKEYAQDSSRDEILIHPETRVWLGMGDSFDESNPQRLAIANAVADGIFWLSRGKKVVYTCAAGASRSVSMAVVVSALWYGTSFDEAFSKLEKKDSWISNPSPLRILIEKMFPELFKGCKPTTMEDYHYYKVLKEKS